MFAQLRRQIKDAQLMEKHQVKPIAHFVVCCVLLSLSVWLVFFTDLLWVQLLNAAFMAFIFGQFCFAFHDAGHYQIFNRSRLNTLAGYVCALMLGGSFRWWRDKHNTHHRNTNHEDHDPDLDIPFLAFSEAQARSKRGLSRFIVRHQALFLVPLWTFTALNMRLVAQVGYVCRHKFSKVWPDILMIVVHHALYIWLLFSQLPVITAILFIVVHQLLWGLYLASVFSPNHNGMPVFTEEDQAGYLHMQIIGSRNLRGHPLTDFWFGGLNYQIEHHLFPTVQRGKLRRVQKIVRQFCHDNDLNYHETGVWACYGEILRYMGSMAKYARA
jgi:fatty acid desaturase